MNLKTTTILPVLLVLVHSNATGEDRGEKDSPPNEAWTFQVEEGRTLPNCIELQWQADEKGKLPKSLKFKNPFLEPLHVGATVHGSPCAYFEIEYYDSYLKQWRRQIGLPGSSGGKSLVVKFEETVDLPINEGYWYFILESLPAFRLEDPVRIRLAYDVGVVSLRSAEFKWNRTKKAVHHNP